MMDDKQRVFLENLIKELVLKEFNAISTGGGSLVSTGAMTGHQSVSETTKKGKKSTRPFFPDVPDGEPVSKSEALHKK